MLQQRLVGTSLKRRLGPSLLPHSNYAAMRCGSQIGIEAKPGKHATGKRQPVKGLKTGKRADPKMDATAAALATICAVRSECEK